MSSSFEKKTTVAILSIHCIVIFWAFFSHARPPEPVKKKLIVQTVQLTPHERKEPVVHAVKNTSPAVKAAPKPSAKKQEVKAKKESSKKVPSKKEQKYGELIHELENQLSKIETVSSSAKVEALHVPGKITNLQVDCLNPGDAKAMDANEKNYVEMLSLFLQNALNLPEYGTVKVKISVDEKGSVSNIKIINSQSTVNQHYLEKILPSLTFPKPYYHLSKTKKHEYVLTFCNELSSNSSR